jgi:hypothetical protein
MYKTVAPLALALQRYNHSVRSQDSNSLAKGLLPVVFSNLFNLSEEFCFNKKQQF